jgi:glutamyl-tRNA synthetase
MILGPDRRKLSKRHGDTSIRDYRRQGYLPEALLNFFALLGWHPGDDREIYTVDELIARFEIKDLGKASPVFDTAKLTWINGLYMRELMAHNPTRVVDISVASLKGAGLVGPEVTNADRAYVQRVVEVLGDRIKVGQDVVSTGAFFFVDEVEYDPAAVEQYLRDPAALTVLGHLRERVAAGPELDRVAAEKVVRELAAALGVHSRAIIHPARVALTGRTTGPGLFELMALLGKDRMVRRLDRALAWLRAQV